MVDQEQRDGNRGAHAAAQAPRSRKKALWIGAAASAAVVAGAALWWLWPAQNIEVVNVLGVDYTTNMQIEEHGGYVYVTVPVNAAVNSVVVEVEDKSDSQKIREFLDSLDTLVPGEHVLALRDSNLHIIVDGMDE